MLCSRRGPAGQRCGDEHSGGKGVAGKEGQEGNTHPFLPDTRMDIIPTQLCR